MSNKCQYGLNWPDEMKTIHKELHMSGGVESMHEDNTMAQKLAIETSQSIEERDKSYLDKLIDDHWKYIEGVLQMSNCEPDIYTIMYHYKTAFRHGWKHAQEYYSERK